MIGLLLLNEAGKENVVTDIKTFQKEIGYQFQNEHLLVQALTHSSYANEKHMKKLSDNERLEFLGDYIERFFVQELSTETGRRTDKAACEHCL